MKTLNILPALACLLMLMSGCEEKKIEQEPALSELLPGWNIHQQALNFDIHLRDLFFLNAETGYMAGYNGEIYKTTTAGTSWQKLNSGTTLHLQSIIFVSPNAGFAAGQGMSGCLGQDCGRGAPFLKTTDGGSSWSKSFFPDFISFEELVFFDESQGLALITTLSGESLSQTRLARTQDGGSNWDLLDLDIFSPLHKIHLVDGIVYLAGNGGIIHKSNDAGLSWEQIQTPVPAWSQVRKLYFYNQQIGFFDGNMQLHKTTNGGDQWQELQTPTAFNELGFVHFSSENEGFNLVPVFGHEGAGGQGDFFTYHGTVFYYTLDGGASWQAKGPIREFQYGKAHFPSRELGYISNGRILYRFEKRD